MEGGSSWFYNGGWEIFKVSLHSWQRAANSLIHKDPPCIAYPLSFFKFCSAPLGKKNYVFLALDCLIFALNLFALLHISEKQL